MRIKSILKYLFMSKWSVSGFIMVKTFWSFKVYHVSKSDPAIVHFFTQYNTWQLEINNENWAAEPRSALGWGRASPASAKPRRAGWRMRNDRASGINTNATSTPVPSAPNPRALWRVQALLFSVLFILFLVNVEVSSADACDKLELSGNPWFFLLLFIHIYRHSRFILYSHRFSEVFYVLCAPEMEVITGNTMA